MFGFSLKVPFMLRNCEDRFVKESESVKNKRIIELRNQQTYRMHLHLMMKTIGNNLY